MQSSESKSARVLNSCPSLMYRGPKSVSRLHRTEGKDRRVSELLPRPSNWHRNAHSWRQTILTISKARADPSKTASTDLGRPLIGLCQWCATAGFPSATQANSDFFESKLLKKNADHWSTAGGWRRRSVQSGALITAKAQPMLQMGLGMRPSVRDRGRNAAQILISAYKKIKRHRRL